MHKLIYYLLLPLLMITSCTSEDREVLAFLGDSIIEGWDVRYSFPTHNTENYGISGSGLQYIESMADRFAGKTVVIITGTNDLSKINETGYEKYSQQYVTALNNLSAQRIILFPILPRKANEFTPDINERIQKLNNLIKTEVEKSGINITYADGAHEDFLENGTVNMNLFYDGLHPNKYGYEILTYHVYKHL